MKKFFKILLVFLLAGMIAFFVLVPGYVDRSNNKVTIQLSPSDFAPIDTFPFIADLHCDMLLWERDFLERHSYGHVDLPRLQSANVALQAFTIVSKTPRGLNIEKNDDDTDQVALLSFAQLRNPSSWFSLKERSLDQIERLYTFEKNSEGAFRILKSNDDLRKFIIDRKSNPALVSGIIGMEGAHALEGDTKNLDEFFRMGVRYIGLAHFFDNEWAGSAHGMKKGGLTAEGVELVRKMDSLGIAIDLAHLAPEAIDDVFKISKRPLIVSHTGVRGICDSKRNLSDDQITEIGKRNGLIGIGLWQNAVCGTDAKATARSMKYVADRIGVDKVCLGSDFDGAVTAHFDVTGLPLIARELKRLGFSRNEISLMMGGNIRDFLLRNLPD